VRRVLSLTQQTYASTTTKLMSHQKHSRELTIDQPIAYPNWDGAYGLRPALL